MTTTAPDGVANASMTVFQHHSAPEPSPIILAAPRTTFHGPYRLRRTPRPTSRNRRSTSARSAGGPRIRPTLNGLMLLLAVAIATTVSTARPCMGGYLISFSGASNGLSIATTGIPSDLRIAYSATFLPNDVPDPNGLVIKTVQVSVSFDPNTDPKFEVPILAIAPSAADNILNNLDLVVGKERFEMDSFFFQVRDEGSDRTLFSQVNAAGPPAPFTNSILSSADGTDVQPISTASIRYLDPKPDLLKPGKSFRSDTFQFQPSFSPDNPATFEIRIGAHYTLIPEPSSLLMLGTALTTVGCATVLSARRRATAGGR